MALQPVRAGTVTPIREAVLEAVADRLAGALGGIPVERARRSLIDIDGEPLPRIVLKGDGIDADETVEPGTTHYTVAFAAIGYVVADTDEGAERALNDLHAAVVACLAGWTPDTPGLSDAAEQGAEFQIYDTTDSARPAGEFSARFEMRACAPTGSPYI
jgi:hypothetical protein